MSERCTLRWVTARALEFALAFLGLSLSGRQSERLIDVYDHLLPFPETESALDSLGKAGFELAVLSNGTPSMIKNCLASSGLAEHFEQCISVHDVHAFKPSALVYQHAAAHLHRPIGEIRLVSCNAFDVVGAIASGMRTAWVNRSGGPFDTIGPQPETIVSNLAEVLDALTRLNS